VKRRPEPDPGPGKSAVATTHAVPRPASNGPAILGCHSYRVGRHPSEALLLVRARPRFRSRPASPTSRRFAPDAGESVNNAESPTTPPAGRAVGRPNHPAARATGSCSLDREQVRRAFRPRTSRPKQAAVHGPNLPGPRGLRSARRRLDQRSALAQPTDPGTWSRHRGPQKSRRPARRFMSERGRRQASVEVPGKPTRSTSRAPPLTRLAEP